MLGAALIGLRHPHSQPYQEVLVRIPGLQVVAVADLPTGEAEEQGEGAAGVDPAARWGTPGQRIEALREVPLYTRLDELLAQPFQVAFVFLPNHRVPEVAVALARAGRHLFCEKPVARSAGEMRAVLAAVQEAGVCFAAGYTWRHNAAAQEIRRWIADGLLGRVLSVEARMVTSAVRFRNPRHYLFRHEVSGGGILHWLGCHWVDLWRFLTGLEVETVSALAGAVGEPGLEVEDVASVSVRFTGGAIGTLHAAYVLPEGYETYIGIRGELGWVRWQPQEGVVQARSLHSAWRGAPERTWQFKKPALPGYGVDGFAAVEDFLAAVRGERPRPLAGAEEALRVLEVLDAIYASARTGRCVSCPTVA